MKTRDRILHASLELFNSEGEPNVTTVDIANELDISPGNLYYHFKGKEDIIAELYCHHDTELTAILNAPIEQALNTQDAWFYLYVVFEQVYNHRYFYRNLNDILQRYPAIDRQFRRLLQLKVAAAHAVATELVANEVLVIARDQLDSLCENVAMNLTFWLNYEMLRTKDTPEQLLIHQGVFRITSMVAPYLNPRHRSIYDECCSLYDTLTADILAAQ